MNLSINNWNKPSNKKWKLIADYLLYVALPAINGFFIAMAATGAFDIKLCFWGVSGTNLIIALFKGLGKLTAENEITG